MITSWVILGVGAGSDACETAEEALSVITQVVRSAMTPQAAVPMLLGEIAPMRHALLTDGQLAISAGRSWEWNSTTLMVRVSPSP